MSELDALAGSVFGDAWHTSSTAAADTTALDGALWATCERTGIARLTLPEAAGGSGGTFAESAAVLRAAGRFAARVPLVETDWLAGWLAHIAGLQVPQGALSAAMAPDLRIEDGRATGTLRRVAWGRSVEAVAALVGPRVVLVDPVDGRIDEGNNVAEEPRDNLVLIDTPVRVATLPAGTGSEAAAEYGLRAALGRSLLLAGAAHAAVAMAVQYATQRVQFGRPLARLQAIQQTLAIAAAEAAASATAATSAACEVDTVGFKNAAFAIAAAKSRSSEAAGVIARITHQVHGAIGFTREHDLRLVTTRLWAWRDEDGAEAAWNEQLGARALKAGPENLWPLLTT